MTIINLTKSEEELCKEDDDLKKEIEDNLEYVASLPVEEYTLYRKWEEINSPMTPDHEMVKYCKKMIWIPDDPSDYLKLEPKVVWANTPDRQKLWETLRVFTHSAHWFSSPGRLAKFFIMDDSTGKFLGAISLGSDFISVGGRESYIGWSKEAQEKNRIYLAMASSISPTQPFGFNYAGGKLIALLTLSDVVEDTWNEDKYLKQKLAGITTTSLFGSYSQYTRIGYWHKCAPTEGEIPIEPSLMVYNKIKDWMKERYPEDFENCVNASHPKGRVINFAYSKLKIKSRENHAPRGVFFASLYKNTLPFLRGETEALGDKLFDNRVSTLFELWKSRYAANRIKNVTESNRFKQYCDTFYHDMWRMSWEDAKVKYLLEVGR